MGVAFCSLAWIAGAVRVAAQSGPPPIDPALRARFGFVGPKIHKIGSNLRLLAVAEFDGKDGGGREILAYDDARARIEIVSFPRIEMRFGSRRMDPSRRICRSSASRSTSGSWGWRWPTSMAMARPIW